MSLNYRWCRGAWKVRRIFSLRSIWLITLVLEECLTYLFILMNITSMRVKLAIMRCVTMSLNIRSVSGSTSIYCCRLTSGSMWIYLLFVKHFHFLSLISIVALGWWVVTLTILICTILLMIETVDILHTGWVISLPLTDLVVLLHIVYFTSFCKLGHSWGILIFLIWAISFTLLLSLLFCWS